MLTAFLGEVYDLTQKKKRMTQLYSAVGFQFSIHPLSDPEG